MKEKRCVDSAGVYKTTSALQEKYNVRVFPALTCKRDRKLLATQPDCRILINKQIHRTLRGIHLLPEKTRSLPFPHFAKADTITTRTSLTQDMISRKFAGHSTNPLESYRKHGLRNHLPVTPA